jgi:hypothetical protein
MRKRWIRAGWIAAMLVWAVPAFAAQIPQYSITDLGRCDNVGSPYDINDRGQVLLGRDGYSEDWNYFEEGRLWDNGTIILLDRIYSQLNNSGQMILYKYFRDTDGMIINITDPDYTVISDLNDSGKYVGESRSAENSLYQERATIWDHTAGTQQQIVAVPEWSHGGSWAAAVNNFDQVTGFFNDETGSEAFLWDNRNDSVLPLGDNIFDAMDINDKTQILCGFKDENGNICRGIWDHGNVTNIGNWHADSLNDLGQVVGEYFTYVGPGPGVLIINDGARLWEKGILYDLNDLIPAGSGWDIQTAVEINNRNQIVGTGILNGEGHGYLLTPVPEPGTMGLLLLGGAVVVRRRAGRGMVG